MKNSKLIAGAIAGAAGRRLGDGVPGAITRFIDQHPLADRRAFDKLCGRLAESIEKAGPRIQEICGDSEAVELDRMPPIHDAIMAVSSGGEAGPSRLCRPAFDWFADAPDDRPA